MSKQISVLKKHEEVRALREILERIGRDYRDVVRLYMEYQRIREKLGKPTKKYPLDPEKIKKDLSSDEFFLFLEGLKEKKS